MATLSDWTIQARQGFAVGGEMLEFTDETNDPMDLTDFGFTMRLKGYGRDEEFTLGSGNFTLVPPVSPATFSTVCEFTLSVEDVALLKDGDNRFELIIDQNGVLIGEMTGVIQKQS